MGVRRISHIVLYVPDPQRSVDWYQQLLGIQPRETHGQAIFTQFDDSDNDDDHDLAFFPTGGGGQRSGPWNSRFEEQPPHAPKAGLYHVSYQVDSEEEFFRIKAELERQGRTGNVHIDEGPDGFKRVYANDPDGLLFEISWIPPLKRQLRRQLREQPQPAATPPAGSDPLRTAHEEREARRVAAGGALTGQEAR